ncbi:PREDICTED: solute carrier family 28 member 3-like [Priapulus caudatus]|uniref:Solute carrier family 28 member 3-like n=1 Tax=Priapulus caudatus TaxID=37621 RepID=A0ABM1E8T6_PRICU|nr:PREDICTED: solute carrier family 28 member 3-like [Priapulus caudatus]
MKRKERSQEFNSPVRIENSEYDHETDSLNGDPAAWAVHAETVCTFVSDLYGSNKTALWNVIYVLLVCAYLSYFCYAVWYNIVRVGCIQPVLDLIAVTAIVTALLLYVVVKNQCGRHFSFCRPSATVLMQTVDANWRWLQWVLYVSIVVVILLILFVALRLQDTPRNLISGVGIVVMVFFCFIFSKHPSKVRWRPVLWGLVLQLIFGILILRTHAGFVVFKWFGDVISIFLSFSDAGASFLFGDPEFLDHFIAFQVLPGIVFFSSVISVLYYLGVVQIVITSIAWVMQKTLTTTAAESLNVAGNIFMGLAEAPLLIKPYIGILTLSELHAVMVGGHSTIAGSVMGAYIGFGISASHLLSASVMSAPAALAVSKLLCPETKRSKTKTIADVQIPRPRDRNIVEAASNGASQSTKIVASIAVNLLAFLSILKMINAILAWLGGMVGHPTLSFELICSYVFVPVTVIMGVETDDQMLVAELLGIKTFLNDFIAFQKLADYIKAGTLQQA